MERKGLVHIYTGDGKGKTTASVGLAVRAAGQGFKVLFMQFFKEDSAPSGEKDIFRDKIDNIELVRSNCRHPFFTGKKTDDEEVRRVTCEVFKSAVDKSMAGSVDLLVLDEMMGVLNGGWIETEEFLHFLKERPPHLEVVITGRNAPVELVKAADYVTEMLMIKHPFDEGISAREGIEF